jgi:hypothetical protein
MTANSNVHIAFPTCPLKKPSRTVGGEQHAPNPKATQLIPTNRQHIIEDLEPYFCLSSECTTPFDVLNSFNGLLAHMQTHLPLLHHVDAPDGTHKAYIEVEFEDDLRSRGEVSEKYLAMMKEATRRRGAVLFQECAFCGRYPEG